MPKNSIITGAVDVIADPRDMADRILQFTRHPTAFPRGMPDNCDDDHTGETASIYRLFRNRYGIDFSYYRTTTVFRRLDRRVKLTRCEDLATYLQRLEVDPEELDLLYRDLLVDVTQFFRDPPAFERLRSEVIPEIIRQTPAGGEIRVWVPACASGEEAYTMAMLFHSCIQEQDRNVELKVFATDVHQQSLEVASTGVYPLDAVMKVPDHFRQRYFAKRVNCSP